MECRTPLHLVVSAPKQGTVTPTTPQLSTAASRAAWAARPTSASVDCTVKKRLPLPKNVVLLSLIEATELASQDVRNKSPPRDDARDSCDSDGNSIVQVRSMGSMIDEEDEEEEKIKMSTSLAVGVAGTYAVVARQGLEIFPTRPVSMDASTHTLADEDVENLVRFFQDGHKNDIPAARLSYGDRVQVVSFVDGWAKLARGYGYVSAENLVKGRSKRFCCRRLLSI